MRTFGDLSQSPGTLLYFIKLTEYLLDISFFDSVTEYVCMLMSAQSSSVPSCSLTELLSVDSSSG